MKIVSSIRWKDSRAQNTTLAVRVSSVRIAFVSTELLPIYAQGALERLVVGWAQTISEKHDVVLVSVSPTIKEEITHIGRVPHLFATSYKALSKLCKEHHIELCVLNNRPGWLGAIDVKGAVILHNFPSAWETDQFPVESISPNSRFVALSHSLCAQAKKTLALRDEQISHVYPYLAPAFLKTTTFRRTQSTNKTRYLFPNRLMYKKGVWALLDALDLIPEAEIHVDITFSPSAHIKDRDFAQKVLARVNKSVNARVIAPLTTPEEVSHTMSLYDGVLMPSVEPEGFGLVAFEALALGIPVITSGLGGLSQAVELGATSVDPLHTPSFARNLLELGSLPTDINSDFIVNTFNVKRSAKALLELLL